MNKTWLLTASILDHDRKERKKGSGREKRLSKVNNYIK